MIPFGVLRMIKNCWTCNHKELSSNGVYVCKIENRVFPILNRKQYVDKADAEVKLSALGEDCVSYAEKKMSPAKTEVLKLKGLLNFAGTVNLKTALLYVGFCGALGFLVGYSLLVGAGVI